MSRFLSFEDLINIPRPVYLIDGLIETKSLAMIAGPPGVYKSFLVLDWLMHLCLGTPWHNRTTCKSKVLYVLGEGKSGLLKRMEAWMDYNNLNQDQLKTINDNFRVSFQVPQMASKSSVDNMLSSLVEENYQPDCIVIDTFARSFVGLDENSQKDVGLWIEQADRLRQLGYTVIFLHHSKKNTEFGVQYRGSSAIMGAMDTAITLIKQDKTRVKMEMVKQKDADEAPDMYFQSRKVKDSMVLVPHIMIDDGYSEEEAKIRLVLDKVMVDDSFESDRARARKVSEMTGLVESAAQGRVARARRGIVEVRRFEAEKPNFEAVPREALSEAL